MPDHKYEKTFIIEKFDGILGCTLEQVDKIGFFNRIQAYALQKGVAGSLIEQSVLGYEPDSKQEADLLIVDNGKEIKTELKTTGMVVASSPTEHYVAKEPMSITAVGVYDIADQIFETSHFWEKLQHMLIVYYHYLADHPVEAFDYRVFPIKGYEFHELDSVEVDALKQDWENVRSLVVEIVANHPGPHDKEWKKCILFNQNGFYESFRNVLSDMEKAEFIESGSMGHVLFSADTDEIEEFIG